MRVRNNKGIALASVMILVTLLALLASTIIHLSYLAYTRKIVEKKNNENFYCAEAVIDNIKSVVQNAAAMAIPQAEISEEDFAKYAYAYLLGANPTDDFLNSLSVGTSVATTAQKAALKEFLLNKICYVDGDPDNTDESNYKYDTNEYIDGTSTAIADALSADRGGKFDIGYVALEDGLVRIGDVVIVYVNDEGFTASIKTDIVIRAPKYIKASDAPLGSYSMFAGSGAEIYTVGGSTKYALNNTLYLHQEGNGYFGTMSDGINAIHIKGCKGGTILSFDGTNIIFNGDVLVDNGGALVFTGGDGTETAIVQVHGFIVLKGSSTLLMAPNVKINCLGIVTDVSYSYETGMEQATVAKYEKQDGNEIKAYDAAGSLICTITYTPYTGSGVDSTVSQFYPVTASWISSRTNGDTYLSDYYSNKIDVEELLYKTSGLNDVGSNDSYIDARYSKVYDGSTGAGVYVLSGTSGTSGWNNRTGWLYNLVTCQVSGTEWEWTNAGTGKTSSMFYCNPVDKELARIAKVYYKNNYYDAEFFKIVNVPILDLVMNTYSRADVNYAADNYNICDEDSYSKKTWDKVKTDSTYSSIWGWSTDYDWTTLQTLGYLTREFYIPNAVTQVSAYYASSFETADGVEYTLSKGLMSFGPPDNYSVSSGNIQFFVSLKSLTVRVSGGYSSGVLLSAEKVTYGESTGSMRVKSLLELSKDLDSSYGDIQTEGNPVHEMLEKMGAGLITYNSSQYRYESNKELCLVDNMFNGGIAAFWKMASSTQGGVADNSDNDLIDVENWDKK